jgi:hypothetical protein
MGGSETLAVPLSSGQGHRNVELVDTNLLLIHRLSPKFGLAELTLFARKAYGGRANASPAAVRELGRRRPVTLAVEI